MSERLRPRDLALLASESPSSPMHNATVEIFDPGSSGFDYAQLVELIADRIAFVPRYRQRLQPVPGRLANPVWVDDPDFDLVLPRTPLRAAASGQPGPAARAGGPDHLPSAGPQPPAVGDLLRRGPRRRPGGDAVQVPPDPRRRRRDRRPRPGAARRRTRAEGARPTTSGGPAGGRRRTALVAGAVHESLTAPDHACRARCAATSTPRCGRRGGAVARALGAVAGGAGEPASGRRVPDHRPARPSSAGSSRSAPTWPTTGRSARCTAAPSTTSSWPR